MQCDIELHWIVNIMIVIETNCESSEDSHL